VLHRVYTSCSVVTYGRFYLYDDSVRGALFQVQTDFQFIPFRGLSGRQENSFHNIQGFFDKLFQQGRQRQPKAAVPCAY